MTRLHTIADPLVTGVIRDRPNRFVVTVEFESGTARVHLSDPGALVDIIVPGNEIICRPVSDEDRATSYDAIAVVVNDIEVSVRASFANELFQQALQKNALPQFDEYAIQRREPSLPEHGRADFRLERSDRSDVVVEVKSCTHVENGVAKFPDRQTARGRRHIQELTSLLSRGIEPHIVFVIQRPDTDRFTPYESVDPEFAALLAAANEKGVGVHAIQTRFDAPTYYLETPVLPIDLPK